MAKLILSKAKFRAIEVYLAALSLYWGVILILPFDTFSTSFSYDVMHQMAPEIFWGLAMVVVGLVHVLAMIRNDKTIRKIGLLLAAGQWYFIATMILLSNHFSTAWGTYYIVGCLSTWLYAKVGGQR
jgi:hypothetical protein